MTDKEQRERVIELLMLVPGGYRSGARNIANFLIEHGVTIREKAKWVWNENAMDWGLGGWICGRCHLKNDNIPATPDVYPLAWVGSNFCPNCGAMMDEEDSDER